MTKTLSKNKDWKEVTLGQVVGVQNGYAFNSKDFSTKGVPILKIKNVASGKVVLEDLDYYEKFVENLKSYVIKRNDILVSMTGSHIHQLSSAVGKVAKYKLDNIALLNQRVGKIYPLDNTIEKSFLWYLLSQKEVQLFWGQRAGGSANQANISPDIIKSYKFLLPQLSEQEKIAGVLSNLDDKIELLQKQNETLEQIAQALFKEWFVEFNFPNKDGKPYKKSGGKMVESELGEIPEEWKVGVINDLIDIFSGFTFKSSDFNESGKYKLVTIKNVQNGNFVEQTKDRLNTIPQNLPDYCFLKTGDILLSLTGNVGRTCYVVGGDYLLNQRVARIKSKNPRDFAFSYIFFRQQHLLLELENLASGTAQQNLSPVRTKEKRMIIPQEVYLDNFAKVLNPMIEKMFKDSLQIQTLSKKRDILLPKLMSGELRINT